MHRDIIGFWMTLVGTACWAVCFLWMHRISAKQVPVTRKVCVPSAMVISSTGSLGRWISFAFPWREQGLTDRDIWILGDIWLAVVDCCGAAQVQEKQGQSCGSVDPVGVSAFARGPTTGRDGRPGFKVLNGGKSWQRATGCCSLRRHLMHSGRGMDEHELGLDRFDDGEIMGPELWRQQRQWQRVKGRGERLHL